MVFYGLFASGGRGAERAPALRRRRVRTRAQQRHRDRACLLAFAQITADERSSWTDAARVRDETRLLLLLGIGTTAGIVAMALVLAARAARRGRASPARLRVARTPRCARWSVSRDGPFGYVVANQLALLFVLVLAKTGDTGDVSAYLYAFAFYQVPHGLFAVSIMTTMTPELARRVHAGDTEGLTRDFNLGLRYLVIVVLPAAVAVHRARAAARRDARARQLHRRTTPSSPPTRCRCSRSGLLPFSVYLYTLRAFYARYDTRTPFLLNLLENGANVVLAVVLYPTFGVQGLALAWSGAYLLGAIAALRGAPDIARRRARIEPCARPLVRAAIGSLALAMVAAPLAGAIGHIPAARALVASVTAALAGGLVYLLVLFALRADELRSLIAMFRRRRTDSASTTDPGKERATRERSRCNHGRRERIGAPRTPRRRTRWQFCRTPFASSPTAPAISRRRCARNTASRSYR